MPQITVLMSVYNGEAYLAEAVESILGQTFSDFIFLILDDASTDSTPAILAKYAAQDSRIKVLTNEQNLGLAASLNRGLENCNTAYVARMDADDIAMTDRLFMQMAFLDEHQDVDVCGTWAELFSDIRSETTIVKMPSTNNAIRAMMLWQNPMNHPTVIFRKATILRAGGYDARLRHAQDYDLWVRLAENPEVQFANMQYSGIRYRVYEDECRENYKVSQHAMVVAVSARMLRTAGFCFLPHEELLHQQLVSITLPQNHEQLLRLGVFALRLIGWGRLNIALESNVFVQCVDDAMQELTRRYYGLPELITKQIEDVKKYEEAISFYKEQSTIYEEAVTFYKEQSMMYKESATFHKEQSTRHEEDATFYKKQAASYQDVKKYEEAIAFYKDQSTIYEEAVTFYKEQSMRYEEAAIFYKKQAASYQHLENIYFIRLLVKMHSRGARFCIKNINTKFWVVFARLAAKIHPRGAYYTEKLEYCIRRGEFQPLFRFLRGRIQRIRGIVNRTLAEKNILATDLNTGQPLVSVVIPCFNYGAYVEEAIDSVLAQTLSNIEIIVVEGGSTDGVTRAILEDLDKPRTTIVYQDKPTLVGENRNTGIRHAKGRYICCLDADDLLDPTYLEKAVFLLETYGYDVVSTKYKTFGARQIDYDIIERPVLDDMLGGNHVTTCAVFRRDDWVKTPSGFVDMGKGAEHVAEDWRFWIELAAQGARIRNIIHESLLSYRIHISSLSRNDEVQPLRAQCEHIQSALVSSLTPKARAHSRAQAAKRMRCTMPGGVLQSVAECVLPTPASTGSKPTLLLCMGLIINGGAERLTSTLVGYLVEQKWRVIVVCTVNDLTENSDPISWYTRHTPEVYQLQRFLADDDERRDFLRYLVSSRKVDVILQAGSTLLYGMLKELRAAHPKLAVADLLFNVAPEGHIASNRKHRDEIDHIITENSEVENWLLSHGDRREAVSRIPSGVSVTTVPDKGVLSLRHALDIPDEAFVLGYSGRLSAEKDPLAFVELAHRCRDMGHVHFIMTGGGPMEDAVTRRLAELHPPRFHFMGFVDEPLPYLAMYDTLVVPSKQDGRPVAVMEAMMLGTPCLASRIGGLSELIQDGATGLLVPPSDAESLEAAARRLAGDREYAKGLGAAALIHGRKHFDPETMVRTYADVLERVAARRYKNANSIPHGEAI